MEQHTTQPRTRLWSRTTALILRLEQPAPTGDGVKDPRPLTRAP